MTDEAVERGPNYDWQHEAVHYKMECDKLRELLRKVEASSEITHFKLIGALCVLDFYSNSKNFITGLEPDKDGDFYPIGARARVFLDSNTVIPDMSVAVYRETLALMAEGEGDVAETYQIMARYALDTPLEENWIYKRMLLDKEPK